MAANMIHGDWWRSHYLRALVWGTAAGLLLLPAVAMRFTTEVNWTGFDFAVMGAMLLIVCGLFELTVRIAHNAPYVLAAGIAIAAGFGLVWVNLAVGFIGNENNPANLMFAGVLLVGIAGAALARLRSPGMVHALLATAAAQALVGIIAEVGRMDHPWPASVVWVGMWLASAALFRRAARLEAK